MSGALEALMEELGLDWDDPRVALAIRNYLEELRRTRERHRLSIYTVAYRMGVPQQTVIDLEHWDSDPTLQRLRFYANAVGARTKHEVRDNVVEEPPC
jgi:transcriptional regulator with XRE-family HTH domain